MERERETVLCAAQFRIDLDTSVKLPVQDGMLSNFWDKLNKQKEKERKEGRKEGGREERRKKEGG